MKRELVGELGLVRPKPDPDGQAAQETPNADGHPTQHGLNGLDDSLEFLALDRELSPSGRGSV